MPSRGNLIKDLGLLSRKWYMRKISAAISEVQVVLDAVLWTPFNKWKSSMEDIMVTSVLVNVLSNRDSVHINLFLQYETDSLYK